MAEGEMKMEISLEKYEEMQDRIANLEIALDIKSKQFSYALDLVIERDEKIYSLRAKQPHWISVKDRLPEELTPVNVVWVNHNPQLYYSKIKDVPQSNATAVYFSGRWYWWDVVLIDWLGEYGQCGREESLVDKDIEITHWMPLPELPEEDKKND